MTPPNHDFPRSPNYGETPRRFITLRKSDPKQPTPYDQEHDTREYRIARSVKWATWVVALVTAINVIVAGLQWKALLRADRTTRESFTAVQRPFIVPINL